jgi:hypothetical protein
MPWEIRGPGNLIGEGDLTRPTTGKIRLSNIANARTLRWLGSCLAIYAGNESCNIAGTTENQHAAQNFVIGLHPKRQQPLPVGM